MLVDFFLVLLSWVSWFTILILCLTFFPVPKTEEQRSQQQRTKRIYYSAFVLYWLFWLCGGVAITVVINNEFHRKDVLYVVVDTFFGVSGAVTVAAVWLPQIYITWRNKDVGSLSVLMLLFTAPGAYLTAVLLGYAYKNPFWVWVPVSIAAVCQTVLLVLCIYYSRDSIKKRCLGEPEGKITIIGQEGEGRTMTRPEESTDEGDRTPLMSDPDII